MSNTINRMTGQLHPFERAGLGLAPFRCIGAYEDRGPHRIQDANGITMEIGAPGQPMGTCDYCGTGIADCFQIQSSDGKSFIVGCQCVYKTYKEFGADERDPVVKKVKDEVRRLRREARHAREAKRIAAAKENWPSIRAAFANRPHPSPWKADKGLSLADYVDWMFANAGNRGKLELAKLIEAHMDALP